MPEFTEDGEQLFRCLRCFDRGWVYPIDPETNKPDYAHAIRCSCRAEVEKRENVTIAHPERPSNRKK